MKTDLKWFEYFAIADQDIPFEDKLAAYVKLARRRFDVDEFDAFCDKHLAHLDETANAFFGSEILRDAIVQKVKALFPAHEVETFTELFWDRVQEWRRVEGSVS